MQEVLNKALSTVLREEIETVGCGRTDTGVHATEFFVHFDAANSKAKSQNSKGQDQKQKAVTPNSQLRPPNSNLLRSLNSLLPYDIAVKRIIPVGETAHARFDATQRSYEYHIHFEKDPFRHGYSWLLRDRPDVALMNEAAQIMMEYRDFSCFSKSNTQTFTNNCTITRAEWVKTDGGMVFHISADRFLRNMVRAIVGTLIKIGRKEMEPDGIRAVIESKNRSEAGTSVPACGLYLTRVVYPYIGASDNG